MKKYRHVHGFAPAQSTDPPTMRRPVYPELRVYARQDLIYRGHAGYAVIVLPVQVHTDGDPNRTFPAWLRAAPDAIELSTGARSTMIPNAYLERASVTRALTAPRLNISLNTPLPIEPHGEITRLRLHTRPWYRRELQRYADEINERVWDRGRLEC